MYKEIIGTNGKVRAVLRNNKDSIPFDEANSDYKEYLEWLAEGNTPEPTEAPTE